jgi:hypothetical protein
MKSGIIYKGPSLLDGKPIVVIATYSKRNAKTGVVVQTYILVDGINPLEASKTGADFSICGTCAMRGEVTTDPTRKQAKNRRCYVNLGQGVLIVYKSFLRGVYAIADNISDRKSIGRKSLCARRNLWRPRCRPARCLGRSSFRSRHFHRVQSSIGMATRYCNAIGRQSRASFHEHWKAGRRTFRVIADLGQLDKQNEALCPASKEAGRRVQCTACKLCKGSALAKSIAIVEH